MYRTILITILVFLTQSAPPLFTQGGYIRSGNFCQHEGQFTVTPLGGMLSATPPISYLVTFHIAALASLPTQKCVSMMGYSSPITLDFNFNLTASNLTLSTMLVSMRVYGDMRLNMVSVTYLVARSDNYFTDILNECYYFYMIGFACVALNSGTGLRVQTRNLTTKFTSGRLMSIITLSAIQLTNNLSNTTNYFKMETSHVPYSTTLQSVFRTDANNTVSSICYDIVISNMQQIIINYFSFSHMSTKSLSNVTTSQLLNETNSAMDMYRGNNSMYFGVTGFRIRTDFNRRFFVDANHTLANLINYQCNSGTEEVIVSYFWAATRTFCSNTSEYYDIITYNCVDQITCQSSGRYVTEFVKFCSPCYYTCLTCNGGRANNCSTCDETKLRIAVAQPFGFKCECAAGSVDYLEKVDCVSCSSIIPHCLGCNIVRYQTNCTNCGSYIPLRVSGYVSACVCPNGYQDLNGRCISSLGCTSFTLNGSVALCNQCDTSLNFNSLPNASYKCECANGYYNNVTHCYSKCGDGVYVSSKQCDDGNNIDGDGCSGLCSIQSGWICTNVILTKSVCSQKYKLAISYVRRINNANTMRVGLSVTGNLSQTVSQLQSTISHNVPATIQSSYSSNTLVIDFNYNQTIQGNYYTLNFSNAQSLTIHASGMNSMLTYDTYYSQNEYIAIAVTALDCLALLLLCLSVFSERMIAIQMVQTIQTVFFCLAYLVDTPNQLSALQQLKYSNGYNLYSGDDYGRVFNEDFGVSSLGIERQFLGSFNIMLLVLLAAMTALIFLKVIYHCKNTSQSSATNAKIKQLEEKEREFDKVRLSKAYSFVFQKIFFIVAFLCFFTIIFAVGNQMDEIPGNSQNIFPIEMNILAALLSMMIIIFLYTVILLNYMYPTYQIFKFPHLSNAYPVAYLTSQSLFILTLTFAHQQKSAIFIMLGLCVLNIAIVVKLKPYPTSYHNRALIFHQLVIIVANAVYCLASVFGFQSEMIYLIGCYVVVGLLYVVLVLNAVRLWSWRNDNLLKEHQLKEEKEYIKDELKCINKKTNRVELQRELDSMSDTLAIKGNPTPNKPTKDFQWFYNQQQQLEAEQQKQREKYYQQRYQQQQQQDTELKELKHKLRKSYHQNQ